MEQAFDLSGTEYLCVERKKVQEVFIRAENSIPKDAKYNVQGVLHILFGDKCLPDKEQPKPKFKVGDKVIHNHKNREVGEVADYSPDEKFCYSVRFGKEYHNMAEHQLEPYTEPEKEVKETKSFAFGSTKS